MEQCFARPEIQRRVRDMQEESAIKLSYQSKERALVVKVISTVALADPISREFNLGDQGMDMDIEFNDDAHAATGAKLHLQLKSGDSYMRKRRKDGAEIFTLKKQRCAECWRILDGAGVPGAAGVPQFRGRSPSGRSRHRQSPRVLPR